MCERSDALEKRERSLSGDTVTNQCGNALVDEKGSGPFAVTQAAREGQNSRSHRMRTHLSDAPLILATRAWDLITAWHHNTPFADTRIMTTILLEASSPHSHVVSYRETFILVLAIKVVLHVMVKVPSLTSKSESWLRLFVL